MGELTQLLNRVENGDEDALNEFLVTVYDELRKVAAAKIRKEPSAALQVTELVNEAYIRLVGKDGSPLAFEGGAHFFAAAAEAMRRILVEHARRRRSQKRGSGRKELEFDGVFGATSDRTAEILAVHEALDDLEVHDAQAAELVKLRYFMGLPHGEAAQVMRVSKRVADRLWAVGKTWLFRRLEEK